MRKDVLNFKVMKDNYVCGSKYGNGRGNDIRLNYQKQTEMITKINFNFHVHYYLPQGI